MANLYIRTADNIEILARRKVKEKRPGKKDHKWMIRSKPFGRCGGCAREHFQQQEVTPLMRVLKPPPHPALTSMHAHSSLLFSFILSLILIELVSLSDLIILFWKSNSFYSEADIARTLSIYLSNYLSPLFSLIKVSDKSCAFNF